LFAAPPKFIGEVKDNLSLKEGASHVLELTFSAHPMPIATWTFNDASLPDAERFKSQTLSGKTSLTMTKVVLEDAGDYTVALQNENGQAAFTATLTVIGTINFFVLIFICFKV